MPLAHLGEWMFRYLSGHSVKARYFVASIFAVLCCLAGGLTANALEGHPGGLVFAASTKAPPTSLSRATVKGPTVIWLNASGSDYRSVSFYMDDAEGTKLSSFATAAPFAFNGGLPIDLAPGFHSLLAVVTDSTGSNHDLFARFLVQTVSTTGQQPAIPNNNQTPNPTPAAPSTSGGDSSGSADDSQSKCTNTAGQTQNWGKPTYQSDFNGTQIDPTWHPYGPEPGHAKNGRRTPEAIKVADGVLTITGDAQGNSGAMKWFPGQQYGRWEGCMKVGTNGTRYHPVFLLWSDNETFPVGGEIDFAEIFDDRSKVNWFMHYGADNQQTSDSRAHETTQWTSYAVEWTPDKMTAYIDGQVWHTETDKDHFPPGPMDLCIQLDNFGGSGTSSMSVDWARQWSIPQSKPSTLGLAPGDPATGQPGDIPNHKPRPLSVAQMLGKTG